MNSIIAYVDVLPTTRFKAIDCICRYTCPLLFGIESVLELMDTFLDPSGCCTVKQAAECGSIHLLDRIMHNRKHEDPLLLSHWLRLAWSKAIINKHFAFAQHLHEYHPQPWDIVHESIKVAESQDLAIMRWFFANRHVGDVSPLAIACIAEQALDVNNVKMLQWIHSITSDRVFIDASLESALEQDQWEIADYLLQQDIGVDMSPDQVHIYVFDRIKSTSIPILVLLCFGHPNDVDVTEGIEYIALGPFLRQKMEYKSLLQLAILSNDVNRVRELFALRTPLTLSLFTTDIVRQQKTEDTRCCLSLDMVQCIYHLHIVPVQEVMKYALATGDFDSLKYLYEVIRMNDWWNPLEYFEELESALIIAVEREDIQLVQYLQTRMPSVSSKAVHEAMRRGNIELLECFTTIDPDSINLHGVVEVGHLHILQWFYLKYPNAKALESCFDIFLYAALYGHLAIVQWCNTTFHIAEWKVHIMQNAAVSGHLHILQWLHNLPMDDVAGNENLYESLRCSPHPLVEAVTGGHFDVVQWLCTHCPPHSFFDVMNTAASYGHLHILQWLHQYGYGSCTNEAMHQALMYGHLEVVQWLHEHGTEGCPPQTMSMAAENGHFEMVQWLHIHYSEGWTTNVMDRAVYSGHLEIVQWLHEHRQEGCTTKAMDEAAHRGHLEVVQWLHEHRQEGCTTKAMDNAAKGGYLKVVRWLHEHRMEGCTTKAMDNAAKGGYLEVVQWLHEHRTEGCTTNAIDQSDDMEILEFLSTHRMEGCTSKALLVAVKRNDWEKVVWLEEHFPIVCNTVSAKEYAHQRRQYLSVYHKYEKRKIHTQ